jgi:hypothetical protein
VPTALGDSLGLFPALTGWAKVCRVPTIKSGRINRAYGALYFGKSPPFARAGQGRLTTETRVFVSGRKGEPAAHDKGEGTRLIACGNYVNHEGEKYCKAEGVDESCED